MAKVPLEEKVQVNSSALVIPSEIKRIETYENVMIALWNDKSSADFKFTGVTSAHLFLLVARSQYFEALATSQMVEAQKFEAAIQGSN